jgi:methionine synthase II (cobalamin-independent)
MVERTVIGSFPRLSDDIDKAIEKVVTLQLEHGIHIISDGEQRFDMINYFKQLPGLTHSPHGLIITDKIKPIKKIIEFYKIRDLTITQEKLREFNQDLEIKISITGPITLGISCATKKLNYYDSPLDDNLYSDLIKALNQIIIELIRRGSLIQIDEPGISAGFMDPLSAKDVLNNLIDDLEISPKDFNKISLHICGDISDIPNTKDILKELRIPTLSLAFSGITEKNNLNLALEEIFNKSHKKLGIGCISVNQQLESEIDQPTKVSNRIDMIKKRIGSQSIRYIHPDCGLRDTPIRIVERILSNMKKASEISAR